MGKIKLFPRRKHIQPYLHENTIELKYDDSVIDFLLKKVNELFDADIASDVASTQENTNCHLTETMAIKYLFGDYYGKKSRITQRIIAFPSAKL